MPTILVVDDEPSVTKLLSMLLTSEGYEVITARTGEECLRKIETTKPDLVIMDMMLPGMDGKETVEKIRENPDTANVKVIFLTVAYMSDVGITEMKNLRVLDYIVKPFKKEDLVKRIKKVLSA
jgi:two-component system response regulator VicR